MFEIVLVGGPQHGRKVYVEKCSDRPSSIAFPAESPVDVITGSRGFGAESVYDLDDDEVSPIEGCSMSYSRTTDPIARFTIDQNDDGFQADGEWIARAMESPEMHGVKMETRPDNDVLSLSLENRDIGSHRVELPLSSTTRGQFRAAVRQVTVGAFL